MSLKNFEILNKVGEGAYSEVHKVVRKSDGVVYALKKVKFGSLTQKEKENSVNEIRILASISHPNVIPFKEAFIDEVSNHLCLVTEFADDGDLLQKIGLIKKRRTHFPESEVWQIFIQTLNGLKALHDLNILHRDIKCANVYLFKNGIIKIGDMNVSKVAKMGLLYTQTGTPYYASPEVWKDRPYDSKSDIWSLGCVIYEVAALCPPFQATDMKGLYRKVTLGDFPAIPSIYSEDLTKLIRMLLKVDPKQRPSCEALLNHAIVKAHCLPAEPVEIQNELLGTIIIPKQMAALTRILPASNYHSKKISQSYPEVFRNPQLRMQSESRLKIDRVVKNENSKKYSEGSYSLNPVNRAQVNLPVKVPFEKSPSVLPPIRPVYTKASLKPSWWG